MGKKPVPRLSVVLLIGVAVVLPIAIVVLLAVAALLGAMNDHWGGAVLNRVALACGLLWVVDLICLVLVVGINSLTNGDQGE